jgi:hypothetical protein
MDDDLTAYCIEGCGREATTDRWYAMTDDGTPILELVCEACAQR